MTRTSTRLRNIFAAALLFLACALALPAFGQLTAGKEFLILDNPQPPANPAKIEVIEFFYYGCPYCNEALPLIVKWLPTLPADVQYRRVPVVRPDKWAPMARTYYTLEAIGQLHLHRHVFDTIHVDGLTLSDEKEMFSWAERNHIDRQKFIDTYRSAEVTAKVARAQELTELFLISGIPAFVIDGKYLTTSGRLTGMNQLVPTVDLLIARARVDRAAKK